MFFVKIKTKFSVATYFDQLSQNLTQMIFRPSLTYVIIWFVLSVKGLDITANEI